MVEHIRILKPDQFQSTLIQLLGSQPIIRSPIRMRIAIQFDREFGRGAIKVNDIAVHRLLAAEFEGFPSANSAPRLFTHPAYTRR